MYDKDLWSKKKCADLPVGGAKSKKLFYNRGPIDLKFGIRISVQRGTKDYKDICISQKTWPPLAKQFKHLLDKVNRGQSERNSLACSSWPLRSVRILKEIGH